MADRHWWGGRKKPLPITHTPVDPGVYLRVDVDDFAESVTMAVQAILLADSPIQRALTHAIERRATELIENVLPGTELHELLFTEVSKSVADTKTAKPDIIGMTRGSIKNALARAIHEQVEEQIPLSDNYQAIKDEVAEQLRRWPALKNDQDMHLKVARTILSSFQR